MEHRSSHRVFRIGEIPLEIRAADRRQCDKDECRGGGDRDAKGVQHTSFGFLRSCELVVQHLKFSESACRPPGTDVGTVSPGSVLTGVSSTSPMATSISASGTESPRSHLDTVCLTTFSLSASSSCERPFYFLRAWMFSFGMANPFFRLTSTLPQCCPQIARCRKQRVVTWQIV